MLQNILSGTQAGGKSKSKGRGKGKGKGKGKGNSITHKRKGGTRRGGRK